MNIHQVALHNTFGLKIGPQTAEFIKKNYSQKKLNELKLYMNDSVELSLAIDPNTSKKTVKSEIRLNEANLSKWAPVCEVRNADLTNAVDLKKINADVNRLLFGIIYNSASKGHMNRVGNKLCRDFSFARDFIIHHMIENEELNYVAKVKELRKIKKSRASKK